MTKTYLVGNTLRIQATFYDFTKQLVDPQLIKFVLYDARYGIIFEQPVSTGNRLSEGVYFYDHVIPSEDINKKFYYEFYGEIGGKPSLNRGEFMVKFI